MCVLQETCPKVPFTASTLQRSTHLHSLALITLFLWVFMVWSRTLGRPAAAAPSVVAQVVAAAKKTNRTLVRLTESSKLWNSGKTKSYLVQ